MNLLQCAPLCDSQGKIRYFIGAQIDVSGLAMEGAQMESLQDLQDQNIPEGTREEGEEEGSQRDDVSHLKPKPKSEFQELGELFSPRELQNVHDYGGNLFHPVADRLNPKNSRLWIQSPEGESETRLGVPSSVSHGGGSLTGVYKHVSIPAGPTYFKLANRVWYSIFLSDHTHHSAFSLLHHLFKSPACFNRHSYPALGTRDPSVTAFYKP